MHCLKKKDYLFSLHNNEKNHAFIQLLAKTIQQIFSFDLLCSVSRLQNIFEIYLML